LYPALCSTRKRPLTKKELAAAEAKDRAAKYFHGVNWAGSLQWDYIQPEDIASFVVLRKLEVLNEETGMWEESWKPRTYLSILIDDFGTDPPALSKENTTQRSDVLIDALCRGGDVKEGYGMLLYGPRLEFYEFVAGEEWVWYEDEEEGVGFQHFSRLFAAEAFRLTHQASLQLERQQTNRLSRTRRMLSRGARCWRWVGGVWRRI
jgi:hypothetical protein